MVSHCDIAKAYKVLFDVLVSCFMETVRVIDRIRAQKLTAKQLGLDFEFYVMLNLVHYHRTTETDHNGREKAMAWKVIDGIWTKYAESYPFLREHEMESAMKRYILECCASCFHFGAHSLMKEDGTGYGLYPLCFVRRGAESDCAVIGELKEDDMDNEVVHFERVKMGDDASLLRYDDEWHEKEKTSTNFKMSREPKICYFTWPAIIETNCNQQHIYGNVPTRALSKIWVQLNDDLYEQIYSVE